MDNGPALQKVFSNLRRLVARTAQSNSGVAKLMRASLSAFPVFLVLAAAARLSRSVRTSSTTVFMIPPRDVRFETGRS